MWFFFSETNEAREVCCGREVKETFVCIRGFFPASRQRQSLAASEWVTVYMQHASHFYFLRIWRNDSSSGIASNFAGNLAIAKWEPFGRFSGFSATMPWSSHKLRSGTTDSKMAARRWRDARSGRHSTKRNDELIDQVRTLVMQDRRVTVRELAEEVRISTGSVHSILTDDLSMRRVWQLHDDNAPAHSSQLIQTFLAKHNIPVVRQAPYSLDMAPCDFWLFPQLKT